VGRPDPWTNRRRISGCAVPRAGGRSSTRPTSWCGSRRWGGRSAAGKSWSSPNRRRRHPPSPRAIPPVAGHRNPPRRVGRIARFVRLPGLPVRGGPADSGHLTGWTVGAFSYWYGVARRVADGLVGLGEERHHVPATLRPAAVHIREQVRRTAGNGPRTRRTAQQPCGTGARGLGVHETIPGDSSYVGVTAAGTGNLAPGRLLDASGCVTVLGGVVVGAYRADWIRMDRPHVSAGGPGPQVRAASATTRPCRHSPDRTRVARPAAGKAGTSKPACGRRCDTRSGRHIGGNRGSTACHRDREPIPIAVVGSRDRVSWE
jgi:hypothetical protein